MKTACLLTAFGLMAASPAFAETPPKPYIDNRSEAAELVRSFYNAIERREFARAWSYFGDKKPAKDMAEFTRTFEGASRVELMVGDITAKESTEGSDYLVPVSVAMKAKDGSEKVFSGCIAARLPKPKPDTGFTPMQIEQADLKSAEGSSSSPPSCGETASPAAIMRARVIKAFSNTYAGSCTSLQADAEDDAANPEVHELAYRLPHLKPEDPDRHATLYRFDCGWGAYNSNEVFYLADEAGEFSQLQFTHPEYTVEYEGPEDAQKAKSITVIGYQAEASLSNTEFSPETQTLTFLSKWQGNGDTSTRGEYLFRQGAFTLIKYEVDATADDKVEPITVIDLATAP